jgi:hypothetical protein
VVPQPNEFFGEVMDDTLGSAVSIGGNSLIQRGDLGNTHLHSPAQAAAQAASPTALHSRGANGRSIAHACAMPVAATLGKAFTAPKTSIVLALARSPGSE